jgi:hypothetical protein
MNAKQAQRMHEAEVLCCSCLKKVHELWGGKDDDTTKSCGNNSSDW